jgi:tripeptide aminopeptidase
LFISFVLSKFRELTMIDQARLLERFLRYTRIDTTAVEGADDYPSSPGQRDLGALLVQELLRLGIESVTQDKYGLVLATIPSNNGPNRPTIVFNAHLDTSPETTGDGVEPQVVSNYDGGDLVLPKDNTRIIRVAENPELKSLVGQTLITAWFKTSLFLVTASVRSARC